MSVQAETALVVPRLQAALGPENVELSGGLVRAHCHDRETILRSVEICRDLRQSWLPASEPDISRLSIEIRGYSGLIDLWEEDLVARVAAGTTLSELDATLEASGLRLPVDAPLPDRSTVGGCFAAAKSGWAFRPSGSLRERALGLLAVDGNARLLKGGARVVKNVAGFDLTRLHFGAHGAFGIIVDFLLRLEARAERTQWRTVECSREEIETKLAQNRLPQAEIEPLVQLWLDPQASRALGFSANGCLIFAVEGRDEVVESWSRSQGGEDVDAELLRDWGYLDAGSETWLLWMSPRALLEHWSSWCRKSESRGVQLRLAADLAGGCHRVIVDSGPSAERLAILLGMRQDGAKISSRSTHLSDSSAGQVLRRLKSSFDPHGLLPAVPK